MSYYIYIYIYIYIKSHLPTDNINDLKVSIEVSAAPCSGACITIMMAPKTHCKQPTLPWNDNLSFKNMDDNTALFFKKKKLVFFSSLFYLYVMIYLRYDHTKCS